MAATTSLPTVATLPQIVFFSTKLLASFVQRAPRCQPRLPVMIEARAQCRRRGSVTSVRTSSCCQNQSEAERAAKTRGGHCVLPRALSVADRFPRRASGTCASCCFYSKTPAETSQPSPGVLLLPCTSIAQTCRTRRTPTASGGAPELLRQRNLGPCLWGSTRTGNFSAKCRLHIMSSS